jgi:glycosyltransferase involved in cell wall biosynthesis
MPDTQIIYVAGYGLKKNTGRNKATLEKTDALREIAGELNFRFYHPASSSNRLVSYLCMLFLDFKMLRTVLFLKKNTVVVERQAFMPLSNLILHYRRIRLIYELHADLREEIGLLNKSILEKLLLRVSLLSEKFNLSLANGIIYNHPLLQKQMQEKYPKPSICSYNGSNTTDFVVKDMQECRKVLSLDRAARYFLFAGMISRWHGVELLIEIFRQPAMKGCTLLLVSATDNKYVNELRRSAAGCSNIVFVNPVSVGLSGVYMSAADICLLPVNNVRASPGSPLKLYDYIACGKPVVAQKDMPGYSDEVERYGLGIAIDFRNPSFAADLMAQFLSVMDSRFYEINNRNVAVTKVSWTERMKRWTAFLVDPD